MLHNWKMCTKKCTSGKFTREKVHSMCTNVEYVHIYVGPRIFTGPVSKLGHPSLETGRPVLKLGCFVPICKLDFFS